MHLEKIARGVSKSTNSAQPKRYLASVYFIIYLSSLALSAAFVDESSISEAM